MPGKPRCLLAALLLLPALLAAQTPKADPTVVVAWFDNQTGDAGLGVYGKEAATWISDALTSARVGKVVPASEVRQLMAGSSAPSPSDLAARTEAGLLIRGRYAREANQLVFTADLVDAKTGKTLTSSGPARAPADDWAAYDALFQDLATAVDMYRVWGATSLFWPRPKLFQAWRTYQEAQANFFSKSDWAGTLPGYRRAVAMDPDWILAKHGIWVTYGNMGRQAQIDSMDAIVRPVMTAAPGPLFDAYEWISASHAGDHERMYQAGRRQAAREPETGSYSIALPAVRSGRFEEVIREYRRRDLGDPWTREWRPWDGVALLSFHTLGRHEEELEAARENVARRGFDWGTANWELRALAALVRTEEVEALLARMKELPDIDANTLGGAYSNAGWEYQAHGREKEAKVMFARRLAWYQSLPAERQQFFAAAMANAFLQTGDYREAIRRYEALHQAAPQNVAHMGNLGLAAVLAGDKAKTQEAEAMLMNPPGRWGPVNGLYWRSLMASQRGDCAAAAQLRRDGLAQGMVTNDYGFHWWNAFGKARKCTELPAITGQRPAP